MELYGENWVAIVFVIVATFIMGNGLLQLSRIVAPSKPNVIKSQPYESGIPDVKPPKPQMTARYYVVAMLFVIFDLEAVFIYPWAVNFDALGMHGFVHMLVFIALLMASYVYAWKKGALEWV